MTRGEIPDPAERWKFRRFTYHTTELRTHGRYVRLVIVPSGRFVFCDEIEVYRGGDGLLDEPMGTKVIPTVSEEELAQLGPNIRHARFMGQTSHGMLISPERLTRLCAALRMRLDLQRVKRLIEDSKPSLVARTTLLKRADNLLQRIRQSAYPENVEAFRAVVPYNALHREIFQLHAEVLSSKGLSDLTFWSKETYAPLDLFETPEGPAPKLRVKMMRNEFRSAVFNITNSSRQARRLTFKIVGLPGGPNPEYVRPHQVEFVDTREAVVVASALAELRPELGRYSVNVPAGMTRQLWFLFHPKEAPAGEHAGKIVLSTETGKTVAEIPVALSIADLRFPDRPDLHFIMFDYVFANDPYTRRELTLQTRKPAIEDMKAHFVDVPAGKKAPPWPKKGDYDEEGRLVKPLDFSAFDAWLQAWPDASLYFVTTSVLPRGQDVEIGGYRRGEKGFKRAVAEWAAAWARHNREIGLAPRKVVVLFVDEPGTPQKWEATRQWTEAFKAGTDEILTVSTATLRPQAEPEELRRQIDALRYCDIVLQWTLTNNPPNYWQHYVEFRKQGKQIWFYQCLGPVRHFDPAYYRFQPWNCLRAGATGSSFWAYCDGGDVFSWNEYVGWRKNRTFTPVYLATDSVTTSKHWEAAREGIEDHQYVIMLRNAVKSTGWTSGRSSTPTTSGPTRRRRVMPKPHGCGYWRCLSDCGPFLGSISTNSFDRSEPCGPSTW